MRLYDDNQDNNDVVVFFSDLRNSVITPTLTCNRFIPNAQMWNDDHSISQKVSMMVFQIDGNIVALRALSGEEGKSPTGNELFFSNFVKVGDGKGREGATTIKQIS